MGHSVDDAVDKISHKMKKHQQNQLKILALVSFKIFYGNGYKKIMLYLCNAPLIAFMKNNCTFLGTQINKVCILYDKVDMTSTIKTYTSQHA